MWGTPDYMGILINAISMNLLFHTSRFQESKLQFTVQKGGRAFPHYILDPIFKDITACMLLYSRAGLD